MVETIVIDSSDDDGLPTTLIEAYGFHLASCQVSSSPAKHRSCKKPNCPVRVFVAQHSENHGGIWTPPIAQVSALKTPLQELSRRSPSLPVGLNNMGATCYINSLLQMLFANVRFRNAILSTKWSSPIMRQMQRLFARMTLTISSSITPSEFVDSLNINNEVQQDLHEFNKLLLQHIQSTAAPLTLVEDEYHGQLSFVTQCSICNSASIRSESFADLQLNLTESLEKSFAELISPELLEGDNAYLCDVCNVKQVAQRRLRLDRLPPTINLHLLRFIFEKETFRKAKSLQKTRIPKSIDMSKYIANHSDGALIYDLIAVLRHQGASVDSGHFIVDIRATDDRTWNRFNDHNVKPVVDGLAVEDSILSSNAYMLVYTRRCSEPVNHSPSESVIDSELAADFQRENTEIEEKRARLVSELESLEQRIQQRKLDVLAAFSPNHELLPLGSDVEVDQNAVSLPIDWLRDWTRNVSEPPLDCSLIICPHGRLNPTQSAKMARISNSAWSIIENSVSSPILVPPSRQLCHRCVEYCQHLEVLRSSLQRMQRDLDADPNAVWISSRYLRALNAAVKSSSPLPPLDSMQEDVLCEHGGLVLAKANRALIGDDALSILALMQTDNDRRMPIPIDRNAAICIICQEDRERNREERAANSSARKNERNLLKETIRLGERRPRSGTYNIVPSEWFANWNDFTRAGAGANISPPGSIPMRMLICDDHGSLIHDLTWPDPDNVLDDTISPLRLVVADEYALLKARYGVSGADIRVTFRTRRSQSGGEPEVDIECSHSVCSQCIRNTQMQALRFTQGIIRIVQEEDAEKAVMRKRRRLSRSSGIEICVNSTDSVGSLKLRIWEILDVHPSRQSLVDLDFNPLLDSYSLEKCGIARNSTLILKTSVAGSDDDAAAVDIDTAMDAIPPERRAGFAGSALGSLL